MHAEQKLKKLLKQVFIGHFGTKNRAEMILKLEDLIKHQTDIKIMQITKQELKQLEKKILTERARSGGLAKYKNTTKKQRKAIAAQMWGSKKNLSNKAKLRAKKLSTGEFKK